MRLGIPGSIGIGCATSNRLRLEYAARDTTCHTVASGVPGSGLTTVHALQQFLDGCSVFCEPSSEGACVVP